MYQNFKNILEKKMNVTRTRLAGITARVVLIVGAGLTAPSAMAQQDTAWDSGWYGGFNIGQSRADIDDVEIRDGLLEDGFTSVAINNEERDLGYKVFGGYLLNGNFAIEGGYFDLGTFGFSAVTLPAATLDGEIKIRGINLDLVGSLPISDRFSAFARAGVNHAKVKGSFAGTGFITATEPETSERDTSYKFGFGLQYDFSRSLGMRVEAERYRIDDTVGNNGDIDLYSVNLVYRFGGSEAAAVFSRAPDPVVEDDLVMVVVPVATQTQQYCSILDMQFEVNQDAVQREYEENIDKLGIFMKKYPDTTALIEGHSDSVGADAANMSLSRSRADNVVTYLVSKHGIAQGRLSAAGLGETRPIADNVTEEGRRSNRRINVIIACVTDIEGLTPAPVRMTMAMDMEFDTNQSNIRPQYHDWSTRSASIAASFPRKVSVRAGALPTTPAPKDSRRTAG